MKPSVHLITYPVNWNGDALVAFLPAVVRLQNPHHDEGQATIPQEIRDELGPLPNTDRCDHAAQSFSPSNSLMKPVSSRGKAFLAYKRRGGAKRSPMPDFYVGAHAVIGRMELLTRDDARYRTYFPGLEIVAPRRSPSARVAHRAVCKHTGGTGPTQPRVGSGRGRRLAPSQGGGRGPRSRSRGTGDAFSRRPRYPHVQ